MNDFVAHDGEATVMASCPPQPGGHGSLLRTQDPM